LFHVHRAWRKTPYHGVGGWLGANTTVFAGEGSRLAGDVATPGSGAYYRQILLGSVGAWFGCYLLLYLIVRFVERGSIDSAHTGWTGWHLKPTKTVLLLRLKSRRRSALPGAAAFRVTTNMPRDSDVFTVDITPVRGARCQRSADSLSHISPISEPRCGAYGGFVLDFRLALERSHTHSALGGTPWCLLYS